MSLRSTTRFYGDEEVKIIEERINLVEKNFSKMCSSYSAYTRKLAHLRDRGDLLTKSIREYSMAETLNRSLRNGLSQYADCLSTVEDYRQALIDRLEVKVVSQLTPYENTCKVAKENTKTAVRAKVRQLERRKQVQKARDRAPINRQEISVAETELTKANVDAVQTMRNLEDLMDNFEQQKLTDIKKILLDYAHVQLHFHAKAIELYSQAYNHIKDIDEDADLQEFRNVLKLSPTLKSSSSQPDIPRDVDHRASNVKLASSTRGSSIQSLVGQLQALKDDDDNEEEMIESVTDDDTDNELNSPSEKRKGHKDT